jgi:hypothetical protein
MTRFLARWMMVLALAAPASAPAQTDFKATPTTIAMAEGGSQSVLLVETDNERFSFSIPRGYGSQVRAETRTIVFTSGAGASVITVQFTTNYAGALPRQEALRDHVAANHPGASLVASTAASTGFGPAQSFELFRPAGNGVLLRVRDVFAAYPEGSAELTFSCNSADFDKEKPRFTQLLNSFRLLAKDGKTNP